MDISGLSGLWWLVLLFLPFIFTQRWLHREIQRVLFLIFRTKKAVVVVFSVLFFPGVLLHEASHYLTAKLLGVRTGRFSLKPGLQPDGSIRMGFVETQKVEFFRNALIGAAPLLAGAVVVSLIGLLMFEGSLQSDYTSQTLLKVWESFRFRLREPVFWAALYLLVTISSMMLPSASDRRDWLAFFLSFALFLAVIYLVGLWGWLEPLLSHSLQQIVDAATVVFATSLAVHLLFLLPLFFVRLILEGLLAV